MNDEIKKLPAVNQRIRNLIDKNYNGSVRAFCVALGFTNSQKMNRLFKTDPRNGKYPTPSIDILNLISNELDISLTWLQNGEGEMQKGQAEAGNEGQNQPSTHRTIDKLLDVLDRQTRQIDETLAQNSRLIGVIERMQGISTQTDIPTPPYSRKP